VVIETGQSADSLGRRVERLRGGRRASHAGDVVVGIVLSPEEEERRKTALNGIEDAGKEERSVVRSRFTLASPALNAPGIEDEGF
jgi:hypothetical protein